MYSGHQITITSIDFLADDQFLVTTEDDRTIKVSEEELEKDFLPIENGVSANTQTQTAILQIVKNESAQMNDLSNILMDNIKKVQENPSYVEQAKAINENAKSLIEIKKTQIEMLKVLKS
jgi:WD40 repeat protein